MNEHTDNVEQSTLPEVINPGTLVNVFESHPLLKKLNEYPAIREYLFITEIDLPIYCKLLTIIIYIRQQIGFAIDVNDPFYSRLHTINSAVFQNIENIELYKILKCIVFLTCSYIDDQESFEPEDKEKIIARLIKYTNI